MDHSDIKVPTIGVTLDPDEEMILRYPPKHSIMETLSDSDFNLNCEESNAKLRYEGADDTEDPTENEQNDEEIKENERIKDIVVENETLIWGFDFSQVSGHLHPRLRWFYSSELEFRSTLVFLDV